MFNHKIYWVRLVPNKGKGFTPTIRKGLVRIFKTCANILVSRTAIETSTETPMVRGVDYISNDISLYQIINYNSYFNVYQPSNKIEDFRKKAYPTSISLILIG